MLEGLYIRPSGLYGASGDRGDRGDRGDQDR